MVSNAWTSSKNNTDLNGEEYRNDSSQQMNRGAGSNAGSMGASARDVTNWRIIQGHFAFDNIDALSFEERSWLSKFLKSNGIQYKTVTIKHRDGSQTTGIRIKKDSAELFKAKMAEGTASSVGTGRGAGSNAGSMGASVRNINNWRMLRGYFAYDDISMLSSEERSWLSNFLKSNGIRYETKEVRHRDGSQTTGIRIDQDSAELFKAKMAEAASNVEAGRGAGSNAGSMGASVRNINNWRMLRGYFAYDDISMLSSEERSWLSNFLKSNGIRYETKDVRHKDGRVTTGIRIDKDSAELFKAKMAKRRASRGVKSESLNLKRMIQDALDMEGIKFILTEEVDSNNQHRVNFRASEENSQKVKRIVNEIQKKAEAIKDSSRLVCVRYEDIGVVQTNLEAKGIQFKVWKAGEMERICFLEVPKETEDRVQAMIDELHHSGKARKRAQIKDGKNIKVGTREDALKLQKEFSKAGINSVRLKDSKGTYYVKISKKDMTVAQKIVENFMGAQSKESAYNNRRSYSEQDAQGSSTEGRTQNNTNQRASGAKTSGGKTRYYRAAPIKDENLANQIIEYMQRERGADIKLVEKNGRKYLAFPKRTDYEAYLNEAGKIYDRMMNAKARESSSDFSRNKPGTSKVEGVVYEGEIPENARNVTPHKSDSRNAGNREAKSAETAEQARQTAEPKPTSTQAETAEQARRTAEPKPASTQAETAEQARQTAEPKPASTQAETAEQARQTVKIPTQSQLGSEVLRMKVNSLDDVLILQEALSKRGIPSAYVRGDGSGHFLSVNAKDMDVLSEVAHERLGYSKVSVNGVKAASATMVSQAGIPKQAIKISDREFQSGKEAVSAHGKTAKTTTAGKITGGAVKGGLSVLSATGTLVEFSAAQESFNSGKVGSGVYHSLSSVGMGAGTVAPFLKGPGGAIAGRIGTAGGSLMFGHDAVEDAQKGDYVSAGINAVGSASMAYETLAMASGSTVSLGTAVAAAPVAATAAAIGSAGAIGWSIGTWVAETYITPRMRYSMGREDAAALVQDRAKYTFKGAEFAYIDGFAEFFNDGFDLYTGGASWGAELNRVITSNESRKEELLEEIERDPQNAYNKGVTGYGSGDLAHANAFLIYEGLWKGAKPRGFESIPENGYQLNPAYPVKSDFSQIVNMSVSNEYYVNENARAKTALMILGRNGGFSADDLAKAAREGSELLLNTMLLTVKDEKGNVRTLYDFNQEGKIEYKQIQQGEHSLLPEKMKTAENMNGILREAVQTKNMSPFLFSVVQQSLNGDGKFKISADLLEKMLTQPEEVMEESLLGANATEIQEEKEAFMTVMCGNKDIGYLFHTWEITPQVIKAVQGLDDERKEAFFRYAIQNNLGKDNPEIQEALMSLMPQTMSTQQQPTGARAGSLIGTIGQSASHVNLENDQSGLQYAGYLNANERS